MKAYDRCRQAYAALLPILQLSTQQYPGESSTCADQVARILRGTPAGDLPVEFVGRFELVVDRRRAREIGLQIPDSILLRADRVID